MRLAHRYFEAAKWRPRTVNLRHYRMRVLHLSREPKMLKIRLKILKIFVELKIWKETFETNVTI